MDVSENDVEAALIEVRAVLFERLADIKMQRQAPHSADSEEQSQEREGDDMLQSLELETQQEIAQVSKALNRVFTGDYGICETCGGAIDKRRLYVIPYATQCIECASHH